MNDSEWFDLIQKICDEKGEFFPVEGEPALSLRYVSCMELKDEILKKTNFVNCSYCGKRLCKEKQNSFRYIIQREEGSALYITTGHDYHVFYFCDGNCSEAWKKSKGFE